MWLASGGSSNSPNEWTLMCPNSLFIFLEATCHVF